MSTPSRRRLMRDFKKLQDDPPAGVSGAPTEESIMRWEAVIFGPQDTPFEDGTFKLSLEFTEEYPNKPPTVKFVSKMFHPNVYADGSICLDILQNQWSPTYDVAAILTSIQSLLDEPNPNSPANSLAAQLYQENRREYEKRVHAIVEQSWMSFSEEDEEDGEKGTKEAEGSTNIDQTVTNTAQVDAEEDETQSSASSQENDEAVHHHHRGAEEPQQTQSEPPPEGQTSKSGSSASPFPLLPLPPPGPGPSQSQQHFHIQTISRQIMAQIDQRRATSAPNTAAEGSTEEDERESEDVQVD